VRLLQAEADTNSLNYAAIVIDDLRRPGLSADDRRIAVLNTAFQAFLRLAGSAHRLLPAVKQKAA
jgi:hypothetical protein